MAAPNGMSDFEIMGIPRTDVNIPKKVTLPVTNKVQKLTLTKPLTPKNSVKENNLKFMRQ